MPTALLVSAAKRRYGFARLPAALKAAGFHVHAVCPRHSLLSLSNHLDGGRVFSQQIAADDLVSVAATAAMEIGADIIIAGEGISALALANGGQSAERWRDCELEDLHQGLRLIKAWFGTASHWESRRSHCVQIAAAAGVRTPRQISIDVERTSAAELATLGTPIIVKLDNSAAGYGVIRAAGPVEALERVSALRNSGHLLPDDHEIVAQEFIPGRSASVSFSALKGRMLEAFSYSAVRNHPEPFGPASVIEVADHPNLLKMASCMVELAGYSGFGGIDAILPEDGSEPVFLEFNARPTQTTHLGKAVGADLCRALACALTGQAYEGRCDRAERVQVALFPSELIRDPNSLYLRRIHHDVPWNEPRIADAIITSTPELMSRVAQPSGIPAARFRTE